MFNKYNKVVITNITKKIIKKGFIDGRWWSISSLFASFSAVNPSMYVHGTVAD